MFEPVSVRGREETVIWTWRLLQDSRVVMASIAVPASISESQCRARAIAVTSLTRASERIGRASAWDAIGDDDVAMASMRRLAPRHGEDGRIDRLLF
jgi:hypothetical protein